MAEAERIKIKYGCAASRMVDDDETIEVPSVGGRPSRSLPRRVLCDIIEPRVEEIFAACRHVIAETGYMDMLASGAIVTGGTTLLDGLPELAEEVLGLPVRRGAPTGIGGLMDVVKSPSYATGVGLVKHGAEQLTGTSAPERTVEVATSRGLSRKIGAWFREVF